MDTMEVTDVYMLRPTRLACMGLGQWFCEATGIWDIPLIYSTTKEAKRIILDKYISEPGLMDSLQRFNKVNHD